jgi:hypothetical protein
MTETRRMGASDGLRCHIAVGLLAHEMTYTTAWIISQSRVNRCAY